ncbi:MAG: DUF4263 domain-containing protein [Patescibacteria group bacterium]|nr:DUF4263 domain-containing protein [Patescibacteria group bacterium]
MSWSGIDNDNSEIGKIVKQANVIMHTEREKSLELFNIAAKEFEKRLDYWNAGWYYKIISDQILFNNNFEGSIPYLEKSISCYQKVTDSEDIDKVKRALAALIVSTSLHFSFSTKIGETPHQKLINDVNEYLIQLLLSAFNEITDEEKQFKFLFKGLESDFSNVHFIYGTGLFRLLTEAKNFEMAVRLAEKYEDRLYYDDKAWLYVAKAFTDKKNTIKNLEKAIEFFLKDTHENFEKEGKNLGRTGWHIGSVTLWSNFFRGQLSLLQESKNEEQLILQLKEAATRFKAITEHHMFPSGTFLAVLCEGLANFLVSKDESIFEKLQTDLTKFIGKYAEGDEKKITDIISALNEGFESCKKNPDTAAIENLGLKRAIELISTLDNWALQNVFGITKKTIGIQASFLLADKSRIFEKTIKDFETLLNKPEILEEELQEFLTKHHFIFGPEYQEVKPKHRLGAEYVMDYALRTYNDVYHLVEIEKSLYKLYNRNDDPSAELVHAEQQVLDWFTWLEENNSYARMNLSNLLSPRGFIIIGRDKDLTEKLRKKVMKRNAMWTGKIEILTYDDLLNKAKISYSNVKKAIT